MKHTLLIGTDFRRSSLKMRERVHLDDHIKPEIIRRILGRRCSGDTPSPPPSPQRGEGVDECVILTTCNRVEIYLACSQPDAASEYLLDFLSRFHQVPAKTLKQKMYIYRCEDAVRHLFRVAAGLESMVVGEAQILGQIKEAYRLSKDAGGCGPFLNKLFQTAIALGREVRKKTAIGSGITSIGSAAAKLAAEVVDHGSARYGVIGCGEMGAIVAKNLVRRGADRLCLSNRSADAGKRLAREVGGDFIPFKKIDEMLSISDLIITATSSGRYIITRAQLERVMRERPPLTIIDIAIPRDVEPAAGGLDNLSLYTIDDLKDIVDRNIDIRRAFISTIEDIIENKLGFYNKWYRKRSEHGEKAYHREPRLQAGACPGRDRQ